MNTRARNILIVDDDVDDIEILREIFAEQDSSIIIDHVLNGKEALTFLSQSKAYPSLIIMDMNMPILDGRETLTAIKNQPAYNRIPVVMLSTANTPADIEYCSQFGVEIIKKPSSLVQLQQIVRDVIQVYREGDVLKL